MTEAYVVGIDAGGTSTRCWAVSCSGRLMGMGQAGPGNFYSLGMDGFVKRITEVVGYAVGDLTQPAETLCLGAAGIGRSSELAPVQNVLSTSGLAKHYLVENDGFISLAAGTLGRPGIAVIGGTGSIAVGMAEDGTRARTGGWGHLLGDEGSGYDMARRGLIALVRAYDGRGPATAMTAPLLKALALSSPEGLVEFMYRSGAGKEQIAALAPLVIETAAYDSVAQSIVCKAVEELTLLAVTLHRRLTLPPAAPVVISGGTFRNEVFRQRFIQALSLKLPKTPVLRLPWEPALGAVFLALRQAGVDFGWCEARTLAAQIADAKG